MTKIAYNACFGGFSLSRKAVARYFELKGETVPEGFYAGREMPRADPHLIQVIEELGKEANGPHAELAITALPAGTLYRIDEYDGNESVMTQTDYEWSVA